MSPLFPDLVQMGVSKGELSIVRFSAGRSPRLLGQSEELVGDLPFKAHAHNESLDWLRRHARKGSKIEVLLADGLVQYAVVPWSESLMKPNEIIAVARIHFEPLLGNEMDAWQICCSEGSYREGVLACALRRDFIEEMHRFCAELNCRLTSIQPYLVRLLNAWRNKISMTNSVIVSISPETAWIGLRANDSWVGVRSFSSVPDSSTLCQWIDREITIFGLPDQARIVLHDPLHKVPNFKMPGREIVCLNWPKMLGKASTYSSIMVLGSD